MELQLVRVRHWLLPVTGMYGIVYPYVPCPTLQRGCVMVIRKSYACRNEQI